MTSKAQQLASGVQWRTADGIRWTSDGKPGWVITLYAGMYQVRRDGVYLTSFRSLRKAQQLAEGAL